MACETAFWPAGTFLRACIRRGPKAPGAGTLARQSATHGRCAHQHEKRAPCPVESYFLWRPRLRDADDDMVLEAAVSGRADAIATFNTRDFTGVQSEFGIAVLTPAGILKEIVK